MGKGLGWEPVGAAHPSLRAGVSFAGTIFKRFDPSKLFILVGQDVTERFHLLLTMVFVAVEEMDNSGASSPSPDLLRRCAYIFGAEIVIDIVKHAVLTKLNDIRPAVYQRFMKASAACRVTSAANTLTGIS